MLSMASIATGYEGPITAIARQPAFPPARGRARIATASSRMRYRQCTGALMVAVLATARASSAAPAPDELTALGELDEQALEVAGPELPAPGDLQALRRQIAEVVQRTGAPGAAVAVIGPGGTLLTEGFGGAGERPVEVSSLFRVGSISKSFLSLAVMRLVEKGRLRLEDRVADLAPEIAHNRFEERHPLTVAHLLEHTSGFDEMRFNEIFDSGAGADRPLAEVLAVNPRSRETRFEPGTRFSYSQPGYTTAAYLIEKVTGLPYARVLEEEVFRPLGIQASVRLDDWTRARLVPGHERGQPRPFLHLLHRPALNLMISADGMSRLLRMLLGRGTVEGRVFLSAASIERIERSGTLPYGAPAVRYGLGNWGDVGGPVPMRGHGGFMPGYAGFYRYEPGLQIGYAVLVNDSDRWQTLGSLSQLLQRFVLRGRPPLRPEAPASALASWVGHYKLGAPEVEFRRFHSDVYDGVDLSVEDGVLWLSEPEQRARTALVPTGPDTFRFRRQSGSSIQVLRNDQGRRVLMLARGYYEEESALLAWARRSLLDLALLILVSTGWLPLFLLLRRDLDETLVLLRPLLAALCLWGMTIAFNHARQEELLGVRNGATIAVWLLSWAFGACSYWAFNGLRHASPAVPRLLRGYAAVVASAAVVITLHLSRYGLIGLRTWRW
jgi:CubicO group peptidase (beta-lactamase class C family)